MRTAVKRLIMEREKERQTAEKHRLHRYTYDDDDPYGRHRWSEEDDESDEMEEELSLIHI